MQPGVKGVEVAVGATVVAPAVSTTYSRIPAPVAHAATTRRYTRVAPTAGSGEPSQLASAPRVEAMAAEEPVVIESGVAASLVEPDVPTTTSGAVEHGSGVAEDTEIFPSL